MESAIYYATLAPSPVFSIIDKIQSLGSKYLWRCVGEYVLTDYIVKGIPLVKRWDKINAKLIHYRSLPASYYIEKAGFYGFKETPKCYKQWEADKRTLEVSAKLYKKENEDHMKEMVRKIWWERSRKGVRYVTQLEEQWDELFPVKKTSKKWLPPYERHTLYGIMIKMEYRPHLNEWYSAEKR